MILLIGGDSEIGTATYRFLKAHALPVQATTRRRDRVSGDRAYLDLAAPLEGWSPPPGTQAACVFAAVARLAACAEDPVGSARINVTQTMAVIDRLIECGAAVLFLSTNQVFDGRTANVPADAPACPVSTYGAQKARVEAALRARMTGASRLAILRLAKVVSPDMALVHGWIDALSAGQPIRAFSDMPMAPAPIELVVAAITALMRDQASGIYQLTGPRDVSYAEVGHYLTKRLDFDPSLVQTTSALAAGLPEGANPRHTTLDSSLLCSRYGLVVPDVWQVVDQVIARHRNKLVS